MLPADYDGVMVTDRGRRSDAQAFEAVHQHKCLAHIQRSIRDVVETKSGRARDFGDQLKAQLQEALAWWYAYRDGTVTNFKAEAEALQAEVTSQRRHRRLKDPDHQRRRNELGWHHDRGSLLRVLADPPREPERWRSMGQDFRPTMGEADKHKICHLSERRMKKHLILDTSCRSKSILY